MATGIERHRELRRRRKRRQKLAAYKRRVARATNSEKEVIARKIRRMTPGAEPLLDEMNISGRS